MNNIQIYLIFAHLAGDFVLQSHWMAANKGKKAWPCFVHCFTYTLCFLPLYLGNFGLTAYCLWMIFFTHYVIDRFDLARYLCFAKNHLAPGFKYHPWKDCNETGYQDKDVWVDDSYTSQYSMDDGAPQIVKCGHTQKPEVPKWLSTKLKIVADNTMHLIINAMVVAYFAAPTPRITIDLSGTSAEDAREAVSKAATIMSAVKMVNDFEKLITPTK